MTKQWIKEHLDEVLVLSGKEGFGLSIPLGEDAEVPDGVNVRGQIEDKEAFLKWVNA